VTRPLVAVVDDDDAYATYMCAYLSGRGYESCAYSRGDALLAALREGASPDVVLLDVNMPGMDGLSTLRWLKAARPDVQVVMLSGKECAATTLEAAQLGAAHYVVKPDEAGGLGEIALESAIKSAIEKNRLVRELNALRQQLSDDQDRSVWGSSAPMLQIRRVIEHVADSDATVLVRGESGVGKELVARALHQQSRRRAHPFLKVSCAALPANLVDSELFGRERVIAGGVTTQAGKFEQAEGGTVFIDEIGEVNADLQASLVRVLSDGRFTRPGGRAEITTDVRVIAATNRDIDGLLQSGSFRRDLLERLVAVEIVVPPLRERRDEILPLAEFFINKYGRRYGRPLNPFSDRVRERLLSYEWPGNVRELEQLIKRFVVLQDESLVLQQLTSSAPGPRPALR
jgi:two-component system response regulator AtoC